MYNKMRMLYGGEDKLEVCQNVAECIGKCKGGVIFFTKKREQIVVVPIYDVATDVDCRVASVIPAV